MTNTIVSASTTATVDADSRAQPAALTEKAQSGSQAQPAELRGQAKGKVLEVRPGRVVFQPRGTNYELHLNVAGRGYAGPTRKPILGAIRATARKVYTVPSGGLFIAPILGQPKTLQGRVVTLNGEEMVVHAGGPVTVALPEDGHAIELGHGPLAAGSLVNVVLEPGASFEPAE